jgi:hydrogenase expression/formation protein HypD
MPEQAYLAALRDPAVAAALARRIAEKVDSHPAARRPITLMEVCGTHTVSIFRNGIRQLLPPGIRLLSGPGCPVCVTPNSEIDRAIAMASQPGIILTTFGDMLRVPGSDASLQEARAAGADVRIVYSPLDAIKLAAEVPDRQVVFFAVGFETTSPAVAGAMIEARRLGLTNFTIYSAHKVIPPAMKLLLESGETKIDGFICPGHVSTIIGARPYEFIANEHHVPCVITGFEPVDVLQAIDMLVAQVVAGEARVEIQYRRTVRWEGNETAVRYLSEVFAPKDAEWRGLGTIPGSGLGLTVDYASFDAAVRFPVDVAPPREHGDCLCGVILRGAGEPPDCPLFGTACTPEHPIGPCMVSTEGTCAAWYHYSGQV